MTMSAENHLFDSGTRVTEADLADLRSDLEADIGELKTDVAVIKTNVENINRRLDDHSRRVEKIEDKIDKSVEGIASIKGQLKVLLWLLSPLVLAIVGAVAKYILSS